MANYKHFSQIDPTAFVPFNDSPTYLSGRVTPDESDRLIISGHANYHLQDWHSIGGRTRQLKPHSFAFSVSVLPVKPLGACSIGIIGIDGLPRINISHFIKSSVSLSHVVFDTDLYSGFGHDNHGRRSQTGVQAPWQIARHHNFSVEYRDEEGELSCFANGLRVHKISAKLKNFSLEILAQAVGVEGDFQFNFENLYYFSLDGKGQHNVSALNGWDSQYPPVFVSYSHKDKKAVSLIVNRLRKKGVRVLGDWSLTVGDSLVEKLGSYINRAGYLIVVLSPSSVKSKWVNTELQLALMEELQEDQKKKVLPILIDDCDIPRFLQGRLYLDLRNEQRGQFEQLLRTIRTLGVW